MQFRTHSNRLIITPTGVRPSGQTTQLFPRALASHSLLQVRVQGAALAMRSFEVQCFHRALPPEPQCLQMSLAQLLSQAGQLCF